MTVVWILVGIMANMVVGAGVYAALDRDGDLFRWYKECPARIAWFAQPLFLTFWPIGAAIHWMRRNPPNGA
jgi:hypothetical protein